MVGNVKRSIRRHTKGDSIGRTGINFDRSAVRTERYPGVKRVVSQVIDDNLFYFSAETFDYAPQQVMGHGARRLDALQSAVDSEDFNHAYDDREAARSVALFQDDYLLVRRFVNDYA
jgi:hypothetical protein